VPLTLECTCSGQVTICDLTELILFGEIKIDLVADTHGTTVEALINLELFAAGGSVSQAVCFSCGAGTFEISLSPSIWVPNWDTMFTRFSMDASTNQIGDPLYSAYAEYGIGIGIEQRYTCVDVMTGEVTHRTVLAQHDGGQYTECRTGGDVLRGFIYSNSGGFSGMFFRSSPLGACFSGGISLDALNWHPVPEQTKIEVDSEQSFCLCATGGTGDYTYEIIEGNLPCGQTLNTKTGCTEGLPDGTCAGSTNIKFRVTDGGGGGDGAMEGQTIGGVCRTFGTGVTRISGGNWVAEMVGNNITIGDADYDVATVTPPSNMTLTAVAGIQDPVAWSYTFDPPPAPPTPGPPEIAEVECGYISETCTGQVPLEIGNGAF